MDFSIYQTEGFYDELFDENGSPRSGAQLLVQKIKSLSRESLLTKQQAAEIMLLQLGITFAVYGNEEGSEKIFPFDVLPRIVDGSEWTQIEAGLKQRIFALNAFIEDIYNKQQILKDRIILITGSSDGIGKALALSAARLGAQIILHGRRASKLEKVYDEIQALQGAPRPSIAVMDLAVAGSDAYTSLADSLAGEFGRLDGLGQRVGTAHDRRDRTGLDEVREHAERRAAQKFPLDALLQSYRVLHKTLSTWIRDAALEVADESAQLRRVVAAVTDFVIEYTGSAGSLLTSEYVHHTRRLAEAEAGQRGALLNTLLDGYDEAIMLDTQGYVSEASGENIFVIRDGEVATPPLGVSILGGITRNSVMRVMQDLGLTVHERLISRDELYIADEVFMVGTAAEVTPIRELDNRQIGSGSRGPVTEKLQQSFFDHVHGDTDFSLRCAFTVTCL